MQRMDAVAQWFRFMQASDWPLSCWPLQPVSVVSHKKPFGLLGKRHIFYIYIYSSIFRLGRHSISTLPFTVTDIQNSKKKESLSMPLDALWLHLPFSSRLLYAVRMHPPQPKCTSLKAYKCTIKFAANVKSLVSIWSWTTINFFFLFFFFKFWFCFSKYKYFNHHYTYYYYQSLYMYNFMNATLIS